jgi:ABC-2 type transport system permease protein
MGLIRHEQKEIMIGRTLGGATVATLQGIIVFFISIAAGFRHTSLTFLPVALLIMALTALLFTAMGTAIASLLEDMQGFPFPFSLQQV